jgi:hypothetical protein
MCRIADEIFVAHASKNGNIEALIKQSEISNKKIQYFHEPHTNKV